MIPFLSALFILRIPSLGVLLSILDLLCFFFQCLISPFVCMILVQSAGSLEELCSLLSVNLKSTYYIVTAGRIIYCQVTLSRIYRFQSWLSIISCLDPYPSHITARNLLFHQQVPFTLGHMQ
jgi:hypothetical protein